MPQPLVVLVGLFVVIALLLAALVGWAALRLASMCDDEQERLQQEETDEWLQLR